MTAYLFDPTLLATRSATWLEGLLAVSIKSAVMLVIAAGLSLALKRASAASRHLVWSFAFASLLALPVLAFSLPSWNAPIWPHTLSAEATESARVVTGGPVASAATAKGSLNALAFDPSLRPAAPINTTVVNYWPLAMVERANGVRAGKMESLGFGAWALLLWMAGALLILARLLIGTVSVRRMARQAQVIREAEWNALAAHLARCVGLARRVTLLQSDSVTMPLTFGITRAFILLPSDADDWSDERRQVVLLHELAHIKRRDCLTQMLAQVACAIYWFNPLIWAAARQLRIERERACDDQVLDAGTKASDYADHLLDLARRFRSVRYASIAAVAIARRSQLEGRVLAILDPRVRRRGLNRLASATVAIIVACIVLPLASLQPLAQTPPKPPARAKLLVPALPPVPGSPRTPETLPALAPAAPLPEEAIAPPVLPAEESPATPATAPEPGEPTPATAPLPPAQPQQPAPPSQSVNEQDRNALVEALTEALKDSDAEVREQALFALSQIGGPRAAQALVAALKDASPQVREKAVWALGMRHGDGMVDALINALNDSNAGVRE